MITIQLDFVGLFLFDRQVAGRTRAAVINADRDVIHPGHPNPLNRHKAFFTVVKGTPSGVWPRSADGHEDLYALAGEITFAAAGEMDTKNWDLPELAAGCENFQMPADFFDRPHDTTHAVIHFDAGSFGSWRFRGENGAFNTRVTFEVERFSMSGDNGKSRFDFDEDGEILFQNTELVPTEDLSDWLWYYDATGNRCFALPDGTTVIAPCPPLDIKPFTLGCSNSQWP